jgi:predicted RecA/RadA family phage recombinase
MPPPLNEHLQDKDSAMKNCISNGNTIPHTPTAAVSSGGVVLIGSRIGVAVADIAANTTGSVQVVGVFSVAKLSADNMTQGALVYWDNATKRLTTTASGNTLAGFATEAAGAGTTTVNVKINA